MSMLPDAAVLSVSERDTELEDFTVSDGEW